MKTKSLIRFALVLGIPLLSVLGIEAVARWGFFSLVEPGLGEKPKRIESFRDYVSGRDTGLFEPHSFVGFTLNPKSAGINSSGFRDSEFVPHEREPGVPRIACLGASTTEGSMAEGGGSFPMHLRLLLKTEKQVLAEVLNFGVSGWTSAESLVNYNLVVQDYAPDVVVIHHSVNDVRPRLWPNFKTDYSHYRRPWSAPEFGPLDNFLIENSTAYTALVLSSRKDWSLGALVNVPVSSLGPMEWKTPAPETARAFVRNIRTLVRLIRANGSVPLLTTMPIATNSPFFDNAFGKLIRAGVQEHNKLLRTLAKQEGAALIDLAKIWKADPETYESLFIDHVHVTSRGNRLKARTILEWLQLSQAAGILEPNPND